MRKLSVTTRILVLAAALPLTAGCMSTYSVARSPSEPSGTATEVPGVPFYVRKMRCKQTTVYLEEVSEIRVVRRTVEPGAAGKPSTQEDRVLRQFAVPARVLRTTEFAALRDLFVDETDGLQLPAVDAAIAALQPKHDPLTPPAEDDTVFAANASAPDYYVDSSVGGTYYFNSKRPWIGSAVAEVELGPDGTLSKAKVEIEDETAGKILDLLPLRDFLSAKYVPSDDEPQSLLPDAESFLLLEVRPTVYRHTLSRTAQPGAGGCEVPARIEIGDAQDAGVGYLRERLPSAPSGAASAKKKGKAISVTGEIVLPDSAPPPKAPGG